MAREREFSRGSQREKGKKTHAEGVLSNTRLSLHRALAGRCLVPPSSRVRKTEGEGSRVDWKERRVELLSFLAKGYCNYESR